MPLLLPPAAPMATFRELHTLFRSSQRPRIYSEDQRRASDLEPFSIGERLPKNADPKKGLPDFFIRRQRKGRVPLISRGFAAFVSSHLYSMSSRLDTKRNSLTSFSHLWYFFFCKSAPQTRKRKKLVAGLLLSSVAKTKREAACWVARLASNKPCTPA